MTTGFVWNEKYGFHDTGNGVVFVPPSILVQPHGHVESAESKVRLAQLVRASGLGDQLTWLEAEPVTDEQLLRVHSAEHVRRIKEESTWPKGGDGGDGITPFAHGGFDIAALAAGGTLAAVEAVVDERVDNAYALVRPPGHHAVPDSGMGFCIFNNIGVAVADVKARKKVERVAVVDYDVHHGNGTQEIFYGDPDVLTISVHQDGLFPQESGDAQERGKGEAIGTSVNVPLPAGSANGAYVEAFERIVVPSLERFQPDLIVVASGFDASANDPMGRMMVTANGYGRLTNLLLQAADRLCGGRLVMSHEGGYSPAYVPYCGVAVLQEMSGSGIVVEDPLEFVWASLPGQELTEWQEQAINEIAVQVVPTT